MSGNLEFKDKKKGERFIKQLKKKQTRVKVDAETGIPGAGKQMEKLEKRVEALEKANAGLSLTVGKVWKWIKQEMKDS